MYRTYTCPRCHAQYFLEDSDDLYCRECGTIFVESDIQKKKSNQLKTVLIVLGCLLLFFEYVDTSLKVKSAWNQNEVAVTTVSQTETYVASSDVSEKSQTSQSATKNSSKSKNDKKASTKGVTPELKQFLDEYEAFIDEYVLVMENNTSTYDNDTGMKMLGDYFSLLSHMVSYEKMAEEYRQKEMSEEDLNYYLEVMYRIETKLLNAAGSKE